jgi:hypothetical protein
LLFKSTSYQLAAAPSREPHQCFNIVSLLSFMPRLMELVTIDSSTRGCMWYTRMKNRRFNTPIGKSWGSNGV